MGAAGDVSRIVPDYLTLLSTCLCSMSQLSYPLSTLLHHETFHIYDDCNSLRTVGMLLLYCAPKLWNSSKFWSFFCFVFFLFFVVLLCALCSQYFDTYIHTWKCRNDVVCHTLKLSSKNVECTWCAAADELTNCIVLDFDWIQWLRL